MKKESFTLADPHPQLVRPKRILYAVCHPTLRISDINLFLSLDVEVVPVLVHTQFHGRHRIDARKTDTPFSRINQAWKSKSTIPALDIEKIQKIDFYRINDSPFTQVDEESAPWVEDKGFPFSGCVSPKEAELINKYFDIVIFESFPNVPAAAFEWFKGVVVFRLFGNETPGFKIWRLYKEVFYSNRSLNFFTHRNRYLSLPVFSSLNEYESREIISDEKCFLPSVVMEEIEELTYGIQWDPTNTLPSTVTNISRLDVSDSWRQYYYDLKAAFGDVPVDIYGKNNLDDEFCRKDPAIKGLIEDYKSYLGQYAKYRIFCNVGSLKQHSQYTPFECVAMGIPVLYLEMSAIAEVLKEFYSLEELRTAGMCEDLHQMRDVAVQCLKNTDFAKGISAGQKIQFYRGFGRDTAKKQARIFLDACETKEDTKKPDLIEYFFRPSTNREKRIFWLSGEQLFRENEMTRWLESGFEVLPLKASPVSSKSLKASEVDSDSTSTPDWRSRCSLSPEICEGLRDQITDFIQESRTGGSFVIELLNLHCGIIVLSGPIKYAIELFRRGYKGIIIHRIGLDFDLASLETDSEIRNSFRVLRNNSNYRIYSSSKYIQQTLSKRFGKFATMSTVSELELTSHSGPLWSPEKSSPVVSTFISNIDSIGFERYKQFIRFFGHFKYQIFGETDPAELLENEIRDAWIQSPSQSQTDLLQKICNSRVFVASDGNDKGSSLIALAAISAGVPVLVPRDSAIANELHSLFSPDELKAVTILDTAEEIAVLCEKCLQDLEQAKFISNRQSSFHISDSQKKLIRELESLLLEQKKKLSLGTATPLNAKWQQTKIVIFCRWLKIRKLGKTLNYIFSLAIKIVLLLLGGNPAPSTKLEAKFFKGIKKQLRGIK